MIFSVVAFIAALLALWTLSMDSAILPLTLALIAGGSAWLANNRLASMQPESAGAKRVIALAVPVLFGAPILLFWEVITRAFDVPTVLLPPPSMIVASVRARPSLPFPSSPTLRSSIPGFNTMRSL